MEAVKSMQELQALVQTSAALRHADKNQLIQVTVSKSVDSIEVLRLQVKSGRIGGEDSESFGSEGCSMDLVWFGFILTLKRA